MKFKQTIVPVCITVVAAFFTQDPAALAAIAAASMLTLHLVIISRLASTVSDTALSINTILSKSQMDALNTRALLKDAHRDSALQLAARAQATDYKNPVLRVLADAALDAMNKTIPRFHPHHIEFQGEFNICESYALMWQHLIHLQKQAPPGAPLHVKTTHFAPIDFSHSGRGTQYLDLQIEFLKAGGEVTQIYLAHDMAGYDPTSNRVVAELTEAGGTIYKLGFAKIAMLALQVPNFLLLDKMCAFHWIGLLDIDATKIYTPEAPQYQDFTTYWEQLIMICTKEDAALPEAPSAIEPSQPVTATN